MDYYKIYQEHKENQQLVKDARRHAIIEATVQTSSNYLPNFTPAQRKELENQNLLLSALADNVKLLPFAISRDKAGHPLILAFNYLEGKKTPELYCYTLGVNLKTKKIMPYCVGKNTFKFTKGYGYMWPEMKIAEPNNLHINMLSIHPAFDNLGIGRILMQATENYALTQGMTTMSLQQELSYQKFEDRSKISVLRYKKQDDYFIKNFFDKNKYFYYTQGFIHDKTPTYIIDCPSDLVPLKKDKLQHITLAYGFDKPLMHIDKRSPMFSIKTESSLSPAEVTKEYCYVNHFPMFLNNVETHDFSPIVLKPNNSYTSLLYAMMTTKGKKEAFIPSREFKRSSARAVLSDAMQHKDPTKNNYEYSRFCESEDFIEQTMKDYEEAISIFNIHTRPIPTLKEKLKMLEEHYIDSLVSEEEPNA